MGKPGASYVDVPSDVLFAEASARDIPNIPSIEPADHTRVSPYLQKKPASAASIDQAVRMLSSAQRPVSPKLFLSKPYA